VSDWVLSKFKEEELIALENEVFPEVYNLLKEKI
jgi:peptidyl-tRNA hydrolase